MNDIFEANKALLELVRNLVAKVKTVKEENITLKSQIENAQSQTLLTEDQKTEIEQLLAETKKVLED